MKKIIALLFVAVMCVSLAACGSNAPNNGAEVSEEQVGLDKNDTVNYIGTWKCEKMQFTFNKGGIGRYEVFDGYFDFKYEVKDEVLILTISDGDMGDFVSSFELNDDGTSMTFVQNGLPTWSEGETEFTKQ